VLFPIIVATPTARKRSRVRLLSDHLRTVDDEQHGLTSPHLTTPHGSGAAGDNSANQTAQHGCWSALAIASASGRRRRFFDRREQVKLPTERAMLTAEAMKGRNWSVEAD
jgi:hypothetical protein